MLANCNKMVLSSTPNQWPHEMEETGLMASSGTRTTLEIKPGQDHQQQQQPLKCPRCDSSNTKFCYYNNYSLSQPRHFCKACKRYWTRGGTLRNVPVGGGYRKNKRVKRPSSSSLGEANKVPTVQAPHGDHSTHQINSLFYGLPNNPNSHTDHFPFRKFHQSYDNHDHHQSQIMSSSLGLNFPAAQQDYGGGFDMVSSSNSMFSNLSLLGSSSLIRPSGNIHALLNLEGMQVAGSGDMGVMMREVKNEESEKYQIGNKMESWGLTGQNLVEPIGLSNGSVCMNPMINVGAWPDQLARDL